MISDYIYRLFKNSPLAQKQIRRLLRRLPHRKRIVFHFNQKVIIDPSEMSGFHLYYGQEYDNYIFDFLDSIIHDYSRALDIGANIGIYSVFLASRIEKVDIFEPDPQLIKKIRENLNLNNLNNVELHEKCVSEKSGREYFEPADNINTGVGHMSTSNTGFDVCSISLDDFFQGSVSEKTLIKMDIEGAEWLASRGALKCLSNRTSTVSLLIEIHPVEITLYGGNTRALKEIFENLNFKVQALTIHGLKQNFEPNDFRFWWIT